MRSIIIAIMLAATFVMAEDKVKIIPVQSWPRVIYLPGKVWINPSPAICISAGYRLLQPAEKIPAGKIIASEKIIQDPANPAQAIYSRTYADKPTPPEPPPPEPTTNVPADKVQFRFTTSGAFVGVQWIDAPKTNRVKE